MLPEFVVGAELMPGAQFRVVYHEDKKGTHVETAVIYAHLTPDEWDEVGALAVTGINLVSDDPEHEAVTVFLSESCYVTKLCPAMPVFFRVVRQQGKKKEGAKYKCFQLTFMLQSLLTKQVYETPLGSSCERLVVRSKYTEGCV